MPRREERRLLDLIRWISAFMVAAGHTWAATAPQTQGFFNRLLWALAETRHSWVIVFFVLSGYLVGGNALLRADRFDFRAYAIARFSRIYIVLIPALLLTAGLDGLAHHLDPHSPVYTAVWREGLFGGTPPFDRYSPREIAASLLSLENVLAQPIGSDGPLWSLGFEWIFYFCFPPLMLLADAAAGRLGGGKAGGRLWLARGGVLALSVAALVLRHAPYAALLWLIWIGGAVAHVLVHRGRWPAALRWAGAAVAVLGFGLSARIDYHFSDVLIGFGFVAFLARFPEGERGLNPALDRALASASYSLYVTHLPVVAFVCLLFMGTGALTPDGATSGLGLAIMLAATAITVGAVCAIFYLLFERNTDALRRRLAGWFSARTGGAAGVRVER
jgi:peptidoglycan/LPS O-acetylase OafA/YrhL